MSARAKLPELSEIRDLVNKATKADVTKLGTEELLSDIKSYIPTGLTLLDAALGGGIPVGRTVEIYGKESSGKSTLALHIAANTQKVGGVVVYIDTENTFSKEMATQIGVDPDKILITQEQTLQGVFPYIREIVGKIRDKNNDPIVVIWDTLASTPTTAEEAGAADGMHRAKFIREAVRGITSFLAKNDVAFVVLNHLMVDMSGGKTSFTGPRYTTPGGGGLKYAATARIRLSTATVFKEDKQDSPTGHEVVAVIEKNKNGAPKTTVRSRFYYGYGFDDRWSVFDFLKDQGLLEQKGAWVTIPNPSGDPIKTNPSKFLEVLTAHPHVYEYLRGLASSAFEIAMPGPTEPDESGVDDDDL